ncbi:MAG: hypothetical protein AAF726_09130 [Planctomycetota bacterium]
MFVSIVTPLLVLSAFPSDEAATELRVHDVTSLVWIEEPHGDEVDVPLLPLMRSLAWQSSDASEWDRTANAVEVLVDTFMAADWNDEWSIEFVEPAEVHLDASTEAHERFARLVRAFESAALGTTTLVVHSFVSSAEIPTGLVSAERLRAAVADAGAKPTSIRVPLEATRWTRVVDAQSHSVTLGVRTEIAQGSIAQYAATDEVASGMSLHLAAKPTGAGTEVGYVLRSTVPSERDRATPVECSTDFFADHVGRVVSRGGSWSEPFALRGGAAAGRCVVRTSDALVVRVSGEGDGSLYHAILVDGGSRHAAESNRVALGEGRSAEIVPRGCTQRIELGVRHDFGGQRLMAKDTNDLESGSNENPLLTAILRLGESPRYERLRDRADVLTTSDLGASSLAIVDQETAGLMERLLALDAQMTPEQLSVDVRATGSGAELRGGFALQAGARGALVVGVEGLEAGRYNVEVAQKAAAREPIVRTRFDGLAMLLTLDPIGEGRLAFKATGQFAGDARDRGGVADLVGGSGLSSRDARQLVIESTGVVDAEDDGGWTIRIGDTSGRGLGVVIRVARAR